MCRRLISIPILVITFLFSVLDAESSLFVGNSRLAKGRWVKIGIEDSGVYEITYEELRALGFGSPERVALFGAGGTALDEQFATSKGVLLYKDDLQPVPVLHSEGKLVFYGCGVEKIGFKAGKGDESGFFDRVSRNLYTETGYYFLTDSEGEPLEMSVVNGDAGSEDAAYELQEGLDYMYHEQDLTMGVNGTGRLLFGEKFEVFGTQRYEWDYFFPDLIEQRPAAMKAEIYLDGEVSAVMKFGVSGGADNYELTRTMPKSDNLVRTVDSNQRHVGFASNRGKLFVSLNPLYRSTELTYSHLDYWILSYSKRVPSLRSESQARILFEKLDAGKAYTVVLGDKSHLMIDVSDAANPVVLNSGTDGRVSFTASAQEIHTVVFDPGLRLKRPVSYAEIPNQDLHSKASEVADMVIITVPGLASGAEKLAEIHRKFDNMSVSVFQLDKIYNEYSSGRCDPMAYRALLKNVYESSDGRLDNVLFLGPVASDVKIIERSGNPGETIVMYQHGYESPMNNGYNAIDFCANLDSYNVNSVERRELQIGVGLLPCRTLHEVNLYADKLVRHITDTGFAYRLNHTMHLGGSGDNNMHVRYADSIANYLDEFAGPRYAHSSQCSEVGDSQRIREWFLKEISNTQMAFYFGHSTSYALDGTLKMASIEDTYRVRNKENPVMFFACCDVADADRGTRGLGETMVVATKYGLMASLSSMRSTYASSNLSMYKELVPSLHNRANASGEYTSPLLGKVYADMKTRTKSLNELTYTLIGDPALRLIIPAARVVVGTIPEMSYVGENLVLKGEIRNEDGDFLELFEGEVVARLLAPSDTVMMPFPLPNDEVGQHAFRTHSHVLTMTAAKVSGGRFEISLRVPAAAASYEGQNMQLAFGAYDSSRRFGAGSVESVGFAAGFGSNPDFEDVCAPVIDDMEYKPSANALSVSVSDDVALNLSTLPFGAGISMRLDGKAFPGAEICPRKIDYDRPAYTTEIPLPQLSDGYHTATVEVADEAGNKAERSITFLVGRKCSATLSLEGVVAMEEALLSVEEGIDGLPSEMEAVIMDTEGKIVARIPSDGKEFRWNLTDASGKRVPTGLYRAVALSPNPDYADFMSDELMVPVL